MDSLPLHTNLANSCRLSMRQRFYTLVLHSNITINFSLALLTEGGSYSRAAFTDIA